MSLLTQMLDRATITERTVTRAADGSPVATTRDRETNARCRIMPLTLSERLNLGKDASIDTWRIMLPKGTIIYAKDFVMDNRTGVEMEVNTVDIISRTNTRAHVEVIATSCIPEAV